MLKSAYCFDHADWLNCNWNLKGSCMPRSYWSDNNDWINRDALFLFRSSTSKLSRRSELVVWLFRNQNRFLFAQGHRFIGNAWIFLSNSAFTHAFHVSYQFHLVNIYNNMCHWRRLSIIVSPKSSVNNKISIELGINRNEKNSWSRPFPMYLSKWVWRTAYPEIYK